VGVTAFGPTTGKPKLVTSFADYMRTFGGFLPEPGSGLLNKWSLDDTEGGRWWQFPLSVKGFFDNGGQRIYIKRVFSSGAVASSADLGQGMVSEIVKDATAGSQKIAVRHLTNIAAGTSLSIFNGQDGSQIDAAFTVASYQPGSDGGTATLNAAVSEPLLENRGDFVQIHPRSASPVPNANTTLTFSAKSLGAWGDDIRVRTRPVSPSTLNLMADSMLAGNAPFSTTVVSTTVAAGPTTTVEANDVTGLSDGDHILVQGREYVISSLAAAPANTFEITPSLPLSGSWAAGTAIKRMPAANNAGAAATINVWGASTLYTDAIVELDNGTTKETLQVVSVAGDTVTLSGPIANSYHEGHKLRVIEAEVSVRYDPVGSEAIEESFGPLRLVDDGSLSYLVNHVNQESDLVNVETGNGFSESQLTSFPTATSGGWQQLGGGNDAYNDLSVDDFVGVNGGSGNRTGIQALEDIDEVSICLAPGVWSQTVRSGLIGHCELLKDRFAIVDPPDGLDNGEIQSFRSPIDTKYAALYYPWISVRDPSVGRNATVAPSAHMAGIYARVDVERGVHKAPANEVIRNISGLAQDVTRREQDLLNPKGINALRFFPGRGNRVWGARTLTSDSSWKYVNVRRLFIFVEESIDEGTQWVVFEPNSEDLWARVTQTITNFLTTVWRSGALEGVKPEEAFFVKCDRSTMTQADIDNGKLICLIGIAPVKPAEFVIFRIQQKTRDSD